jgi:hypothetical protein
MFRARQVQLVEVEVRLSGLQVEFQGAAGDAASEVQAHLSGFKEEPAAALAACIHLKAALSRQFSEVQRWAAALHVEGVRQGAAMKIVAHKEAHLAGLVEMEERLRQEERELLQRAREIETTRVRNCTPCCH